MRRRKKGEDKTKREKKKTPEGLSGQGRDPMRFDFFAYFFLVIGSRDRQPAQVVGVWASSGSEGEGCG